MSPSEKTEFYSRGRRQLTVAILAANALGALLVELAKGTASRVLASEAILAQVDGTEAGRWRLGEAVTLRGRPAPTRTAAPV
jgi:adenylate cyclase